VRTPALHPPGPALRRHRGRAHLGPRPLAAAGKDPAQGVERRLARIVARERRAEVAARTQREKPVRIAPARPGVGGRGRGRVGARPARARPPRPARPWACRGGCGSIRRCAQTRILLPSESECCVHALVPDALKTSPREVWSGSSNALRNRQGGKTTSNHLVNAYALSTCRVHRAFKVGVARSEPRPSNSPCISAPS